jgi:hypothetical protein
VLLVRFAAKRHAEKLIIFGVNLMMKMAMKILGKKNDPKT